MLDKIVFLKNKYFILCCVLILIIIGLGVAKPYILKYTENNFGNNLHDKIAGIESGIQDYFSDEEKTLQSAMKSLLSTVKINDDTQILTNVLNSGTYDIYSVIVLDSAYNVISGSGTFENGDIISACAHKENTIFFLHSSLIDYLSLYKDIKISGSNYRIIIGLTSEKRYTLNTTFFKNVSLDDALSKKFLVNVDVYPEERAFTAEDGRRTSFTIFNSAKEKIAAVVFDNPSLYEELDKRSDFISLLQIISLFFILVIILRISSGYFVHLKSKPLQYLIFAAAIVIIRILLFIFEIPGRFIGGDLTDAQYFSSVFGYGMVRSPLELFITVVSILFVIIIVYKTVLALEMQRIKSSWILRTIISLLLITIYFLTLRAFGASMRSSVYDSSLKYFKDPFIIPDLPSFVMHLNILFIGLGAVLFSVSIIIFFFKMHHSLKKSGLIILFFVLQIVGFLYDLIQSDPQGNALVRSLYILFTLVSAYWVYQFNIRTIFKYSVFLLSASFLSILLLIYYNDNMERTTLPITAQEFLKRNEKYNEYLAESAASQFSKDQELIEAFRAGISNYNALAFKLWSGSVFPREILSVRISILDHSLKVIGNYNYNYDNDSLLSRRFEKTNIIQKASFIEPSSKEKITMILAPVEQKNLLMGYVEIDFRPYNNYFNNKSCYRLLSSNDQKINSTIEFSQLNVFRIEDGVVKNTIGDISLDEQDISNFSNYLDLNSDGGYINSVIDGKSYMIFLRKDEQSPKPGILGVALRARDVTVDLFDFFKVFFIHSLIILIFTLLAFLLQIKKLWPALFNFRAKILYALVIISIVPLFLSAAYFKYLVGNKNREDINNKLTRRAIQINKYIKNYSAQSNLSEQQIYNKAHTDLGTEFTVYDSEKLIYATLPGFYESGLLSDKPSFDIKSSIEGNSDKQFLQTDKIDDYSFNSFYLVTRIKGKAVIINVNDAFNELSFSLSNLEVDIFLFGSYSFAAVMIMLFSSFIAGQISKPISIITGAASAVAEGDLDTKVEYNARGEIRYLVDGFNDMVRKLKKSQIDLAEFERETAWKEMARQVAHEIKNPLTPMKLSIQQLIASYNDKSNKFDSIFDKVTSTIISQIETLNKIASEFSNFARMPKMKIEKVDLIKICREASGLFDTDLKINIMPEKEEIIIMADPDQTRRSFINLIRNSIQAEATELEIIIKENFESVEIYFKDNGNGIPKDILEKVFDENFTTKIKGMGIGLSMARKYFELLKGSISIADTSAKGTIFLITIPKTGI